MLEAAKNCLRVAFWGGEIFRIHRATARLTPLKIRSATDRDRDACLAIYRSNEPNRFPDGYYEIFKDYLHAGKYLVLVAEKDSKIVATGGIAIHQNKGIQVSMLSYGMVLPDYQGRGVGTTLLLARVSLLPRTKDKWIVCMTSVGGSDSFYRRYGFRYVSDIKGKRDDRFPLFKTLVLRDDLKKIDEAIAQHCIEIDSGPLQVPTVLEDETA